MDGNTTLAAKLDILIEDFKEFRKDQKDTNKDLKEHVIAEDKVQARIATNVQWHTTIGSFIVVAFIAFGAYLQLALNGTIEVVNKIYNDGAYYRENRSTTIEIIELYKKHDLCSEQTSYRNKKE
jgi:hypothetical protein